MSSQDQTTKDQTTAVDEKLATRDLLDTAMANGSCSRFVEAARFAGVASLLKGPELLTVFIPTDAAFSPVEMENRDELGTLISRHIVRGRLTAADFKLSSSLKSLVDCECR